MRVSFLALSLVLFVGLMPAYTYDENLARELVSPAAISYCKQEDQRVLSCGPHCDKMKNRGYKTLFAELLPNGPITSEAFSIFYKSSSNQVIVSFRGTANPLQLIQEISNPLSGVYALQSGYDKLRVSSYFYNKYKNTIRSKLMQNINIVKSQYPKASWIITGHSLGGALATVATLDLLKSGTLDKSKTQVYNFGSPRVGNYEFTQALTQEVPVYRIVNSNDPVTHLPPCIKSNNKCSKDPQQPGPTWLPYHIDKEIYYPDASMRAGQYKICMNEDMNCSSGIPGLKFDLSTHLYYFGERIGCPNKN